MVADRYLIGRKLGAGGMGVVVGATDKLLAISVALKFLLPRAASAEQSASRLVREAQSIARIRSEHVVRLMDVGLFRGLPFLVMEYLEGEDLRRLVQRRGRLRLDVAVDYVLQALQAVAEAHAKSIVHRDLKANNLFLTRRIDGSALIKVIDFGIAKTLEADALAMLALTSTHESILGSPTHMSPEQLKDPRAVDCRTDIWALGITLYELLTGVVPFAHDNYSVLLTAIATATPARLRDSRPEIPRAFQDVLDRCLEKTADRRVATALELAELLAPFGGADAQTSLARIRGTVEGHASDPEGRHIAWPSASFADTQPASDRGPRTDSAWGSTSSHRRPSVVNSSRPRRRRVRATVAASSAVLGAGIFAYAWQGDGGPSQPARPAVSVPSITAPGKTVSRVTSTVQSAVPGLVFAEHSSDVSVVPGPPTLSDSAAPQHPIPPKPPSKAAPSPTSKPASPRTSKPASSATSNPAPSAGRPSIDELIEERR